MTLIAALVFGAAAATGSSAGHRWPLQVLQSAGLTVQFPPFLHPFVCFNVSDPDLSSAGVAFPLFFPVSPHFMLFFASHSMRSPFVLFSFYPPFSGTLGGRLHLSRTVRAAAQPAAPTQVKTPSSVFELSL